MNRLALDYYESVSSHAAKIFHRQDLSPVHLFTSILS